MKPLLEYHYLRKQGLLDVGVITERLDGSLAALKFFTMWGERRLLQMEALPQLASWGAKVKTNG